MAVKHDPAVSAPNTIWIAGAFGWCAVERSGISFLGGASYAVYGTSAE